MAIIAPMAYRVTKRPCAGCGTSFALRQTAAQRRYCYECRPSQWRPEPEIVRCICGAEVVSGRYTQRYCSRSCASRALAAVRTIERTCPCGVRFMTGMRRVADLCRPCRDRARQVREYGVSEGEYRRLVAAGCAICGGGSADETLHLDHDHTTGQFRGLLCQKCNTGIGLLGDDIDGLTRAVQYLQRVKDPATLHRDVHDEVT